MEKTILILGAGTGLGQGVASHYGKMGYKVALVARNAQKLAAIAESLRADGITAETFIADLNKPEALNAAITAAQTKLGDIDALYHAPNISAHFSPAFGLAPEEQTVSVSILYLSLIQAVNAVLPAMRKKREGSILVAFGGSAAVGMPFMSGPGPAMAAARNYLQSLQAELAGEKINVGFVTIRAIIRDSAFHRGLKDGTIANELPPHIHIPEVDPSELAAILQTVAEDPGQSEALFPAAALSS